MILKRICALRMRSCLLRMRSRRNQREIQNAINPSAFLILQKYFTLAFVGRRVIYNPLLAQICDIRGNAPHRYLNKCNDSELSIAVAISPFRNITWPTCVSIHDKTLKGGKIHRYNYMRDFAISPTSSSSVNRHKTQNRLKYLISSFLHISISFWPAQCLSSKNGYIKYNSEPRPQTSSLLYAIFILCTYSSS